MTNPLGRKARLRPGAQLCSAIFLLHCTKPLTIFEPFPIHYVKFLGRALQGEVARPFKQA